MSKTVIGWLCIYFGGIFASFWKGPIFGLLTYFFTFYTQYSWMRPHRHERWSLYASIAMVAAYFLRKSSLDKLAHLSIPQLKWLLLFSANCLVVGLFAVRPNAHQKEVTEIIKLVVLYCLIVCIVRTKLHYKMVIWLQVWGNFLFGWQGHGKKLFQGRLEGVGGPTTNTSNGLANHAIMILPFLNNMFFLGNKWERIAAVWAAPWILNLIILCNSRGAFLGILVMGTIIFVRSDKKMRKKILVGAVLGGLLFVYLSDERFWDRMDTIDDPSQKGSGRIETWLGAMELISDHPFGVGGGGFVHLSPVYIPEIVEEHRGQRRSVHNSYLDVATSYGIQGLFFYGCFIAGTLLELRKIRKRTGTANDTFYYAESTAIETAIWGFLAAATFGARAYFEAMFWFSALGVALSNIQQSEIKDQQKAQVEASDTPEHVAS